MGERERHEGDSSKPPFLHSCASDHCKLNQKRWKEATPKPMQAETANVDFTLNKFVTSRLIFECGNSIVVVSENILAPRGPNPMYL
jgi:hypothetical protein